MNDFEERKKALLQPLLFEAGAALMDCQTFEFGVGLLIFHLSRLGGTEGLEPDKVMMILDDKDKKTAGQLVAILKRHVEVSEGIEKALQEALAARNKIVHRILIDNIESVLDKDALSHLVKDIRTLRSRVQAADKLLQPFNYAFSEALDGVAQDELEIELKKALE